MARNIVTTFEVDWDGNGAYTDESSRFISAQGDVRYAAPFSSLVGGAGITGQMTVTLANHDGRYSPLNSSSAIYADIANGGSYMRKCRLYVSIDNGSNDYAIFYGVLKLPAAQAPTWNETSTVTFDCRTWDELLLNRRWSSSQSLFYSDVNSPDTEAGIMLNWITDPDNGFTVDNLDLDGGLFLIPYPWMDDESLLEEMWLLAAACGGRFYADHSGAFRYENMAAWQTETRSTTSQQTYTPASWQRMEFAYDDTDLYNEVTVEASPRIVGGVDVVWESESIVTVQPGKTETVTARFDAPVYTVSSIDFAARTAGGASATANVTVTPTYKAQRATLVIANTGTVTAYLTKLRILGRPVIGGPEQEVTRTSAAHGANSAYFAGRINRNRRVGGNPYIQSMPQAQTLAQRVLDVSEYPRLTFFLIGTPGKPDRRLGDRITIDNTGTYGIMSSTVACYVVGIRWMLDSNGFTQDLEAVQAANVFAHDNNYFIIGTHALGSTRRLFY